MTHFIKDRRRKAKQPGERSRGVRDTNVLMALTHLHHIDIILKVTCNSLKIYETYFLMTILITYRIGKLVQYKEYFIVNNRFGWDINRTTQ